MMTRSALARHLKACSLFAALLILAGGVAVGEEQADTDRPIAVAEFRLKTLDGATVSLHERLQQGPVLISFWATWCKPCRQELPHLDDIRSDWKARGLSVYAVSIDKPRSQAKVRTYVRSHNFEFDVLLDPNSTAFRQLHGQSVPYVVLLDQTGDTVYVKSGYRPGDEKELAAAVSDLFAAARSDDAVEDTP